MKFKASRGKNVQERLSTFHSEMLTAKNRLCACVRAHVCRQPFAVSGECLLKTHSLLENKLCWLDKLRKCVSLKKKKIKQCVVFVCKVSGSAQSHRTPSGTPG